MALPPILFDLDGTLTDPAPGFLASLRHAMEGLGINHRPDDELIRFIGPPLRQTMGEILETDDRDLIEEGVRLYRWRLDNGGKYEATVFEGIPLVLEHFVSRGHDLFVCTGKPECVATEIVHHFELHGFFRNVYGAKLDGRHCDKADLIRHIWSEEDISHERGIMIGDTVFDIRGAKANNLAAIAVEWGFGESDDLLAHGADCLVTDPAHLIPAIERFT
jgi:phosphoglycolate phosphatase